MCVCTMFQLSLSTFRLNYLPNEAKIRNFQKIHILLEKNCCMSYKNCYTLKPLNESNNIALGSTPKIRPSHHKYFSLQNSFCESHTSRLVN